MRVYLEPGISCEQNCEPELIRNLNLYSCALGWAGWGLSLHFAPWLFPGLSLELYIASGLPLFSSLSWCR